MSIRKATAVWSGTLKAGKGNMTTESGTLKNINYSFHDRFEDGKGTNPEELIAAAHAGCYAMALSGGIEKAGKVADSIEAVAHVTLDMVNGAPTVTKSHIVCTAKVPGMDATTFHEIAVETKGGCPISRLLMGSAEITLDAKLA
ncbi:MAG: OsmC family protein [Calditrichaeota bacterium]|nr:OsmC family protein [Calditrichota bacterium]MCB9369462.1 OsmC family protein [Calditrichota bacterium]